MTQPDFRSISEERKSAMRHVYEEWKRVRASAGLFEESLRILASDKRPTADRFIREDDTKASALIATYGKGYRCRLSLPKKDASILLELVTGIRGVAENEAEARKMIRRAFSMLLDGTKPPSTLSDPRWEPLLKVLSGFDPSVNQASLFP